MMKKLLIAGLCTLFFYSCQKDGTVGPSEVPTGSFEEVISAGGDFAPVSESKELLETTLENDNRDGEMWRCETETYEANYGGGGDAGFPQFNPNASVVYPGNLLQGKTLNKATPSVISVPRAGGTISIDIYDGSSRSFFEVDEVTKSAIGQAANNIIAGSTGSIPANLDFSYETIYSREQLAVSLGVDYHTAFSSVEANLSFSTDREYNRTIVKLNQSYYTMSFDLPTSYDDLFAPGVTPADLAKYVQPDNPVTYISDVTYGRIYYLLVETTSSVEQMEAAITGSFSGVGGTGGGAEAEVDKLSQLKNMRIKLFAFGGDAATTIMTIADPGNLNSLADLLAESTDIRTGKPISYVVRSAYSNEIVSVSLNTKYDVTKCEALNPNGPPLPYMEHWTGILTTFGPVGAAFSVDGTTSFYLFNEAGDEFLISTQDELKGPFPLSELGDGTCPLKDIGAGAYIESTSLGDGTVMLFDKSGVRYTYLFLDNGQFLGVEDITGFGAANNNGQGDCPFNLTGISAMLSYDKKEDSPGYWLDRRMVFEKNTRRYSIFDRKSNTFDGVRYIDQFVLNNPFPFEGSVAAAAGFELDDTRYRLIFNERGDKYVVAVPSWHGGSYLGPFGL